MFVLNPKASESTLSYAFRLARFNGLLTVPFFYKYILLKNGGFVSSKKLAGKLYDLIGESHSVLFEEVTKRTQDILNNHRVSRYPIVDSEGYFPDDEKVYEKYDKTIRYCPTCILEQHHWHGHSWLKRDWLYNHRCLVHEKKMLSIGETSDELGLNIFDTFKYVFDGKLVGFEENYARINNQYESRPGILAPCVLVDYFTSTRRNGYFDFKEYECSFSSLNSLFYQYLNCFPSNEKEALRQYLFSSVDTCSKEGFYFYKARKPCIECPHKKYCLYNKDDTILRPIDEMDVESILEFVFQCSCLPEHISERQLTVYSDLITHVNDFFEPLSYEADTINWLITLMHSTYSTHSEFISKGESSPKFDNIRREPISGLLVLTLRRERVNSSYRVVPLPRNFEKHVKKYVEKRFNGKFSLNNPLVASKSGLKSIYPGDLNKLIRKSIKLFNAVPVEGLNLHSIRDAIAASAIVAGANMQYVTKSSGLAYSQLQRKDVLPIESRLPFTLM
ncbi:hypothetical protein HWV03_00555 [Moritella sp. 36]|uniref:hypothetical protein n=1 Tax=Moritella sp. 36 TaxID=2746233 RepID=UPI001BA7F650|nr:hypothetical protein [Moritella sp. 36]QUM87430.1 hypothetical protein HWV03_00555 [Moritella sp. 36]